MSLEEGEENYEGTLVKTTTFVGKKYTQGLPLATRQGHSAPLRNLYRDSKMGGLL
jgi:hypothetical protein